VLLSSVEVAANPATALESHPCTFYCFNSLRIKSLRKNTPGEGHRPLPSDFPLPPNPDRTYERKLSQLRQNLLLVRHNRVQRRLILQDHTLILLDRLLIRLDLLLVGNNRRLIRDDPLLVCNASVWHVFDLPQRLSLCLKRLKLCRRCAATATTFCTERSRAESFRHLQFSFLEPGKAATSVEPGIAAPANINALLMEEVPK
jgi:hypothetical protein